MKKDTKTEGTLITDDSTEAERRQTPKTYYSLVQSLIASSDGVIIL